MFAKLPAKGDARREYPETPLTDNLPAHTDMSLPRKRIAIVGSGVSGLAALYTLRNSGHEVHLFEQADRLGGHTNTVDWNWEGKSIKVDTGFIVLNSFTYRKYLTVHYKYSSSISELTHP
jgi:predicted NAD/FAD-binding protein